MTARDEIISAVRRHLPGPAPLPEDARFEGVRYPDVVAQFAKSVASVGGACIEVHGPLEDALLALPEYTSAKSVASLVPGVQRTNIDAARISAPHALQHVDFCVIPGELGVAENGAIWITNHGGLGRAVLFLAQRIAIVLHRSKLVHNLHEAYARIEIPRPGFGVFISGPSKTADIEQALVIGAHGARACTVLLTD